MNLNELNEKRKRLTKWAQFGLLFVALVVAPIVYTVIKGLIGLAIAGVIGLAIVTFAPALSMKFANWKLKAIKAEASKNPVETLQNVYNERIRQKQVIKEKIGAFRTKVMGFADKVEGFKERFPADAEKFEQQLEKMRKLLSRREQKYIKIGKDLEMFAGVIERADAIWQMGLAAAEMNEAAGEFDGEQVYERIKVETALDSVQETMNMAFSEMESDLLEDDLIPDQPKQIELVKEADVIELSVDTRSKVRAH
jgi:hypothetical protein